MGDRPLELPQQPQYLGLHQATRVVVVQELEQADEVGPLGARYGLCIRPAAAPVVAELPELDAQVDVELRRDLIESLEQRRIVVDGQGQVAVVAEARQLVLAPLGEGQDEAGRS